LASRLQFLMKSRRSTSAISVFLGFVLTDVTVYPAAVPLFNRAERTGPLEVFHLEEHIAAGHLAKRGAPLDRRAFHDRLVVETLVGRLDICERDGSFFIAHNLSWVLHRGIV
jgi:hypothetical protein